MKKMNYFVEFLRLWIAYSFAAIRVYGSAHDAGQTTGIHLGTRLHVPIYGFRWLLLDAGFPLQSGNL